MLPMRHLAALCATALPTAGQVDWTRLSVGGGPPERNASSMAYVFRRGETFLYSGWSPTLALTDLWSWDGAAWTQVDASAPPGMRWGHAMAYDLLRDRLVVFGGARGFYINDTWELDCQAMTWAQLTPASAPGPRAAMSSAYDLARGVVVVFGGSDFGTTYDETWEWDGANWTQRTFATTPPARDNHGMVYDFGRQRIVMFGGRGLGGTLGDTWEYDGTAWIRRNPATAPPPRAVHALAWDAERERTVMHGGNSNPWQPSGVAYDETWEWDGNDWMRRSPTNDPANAWQRIMSFDHATGQVLLFGGGPTLDELWALEPVYRARATTWASGCPGSAGTPLLFSSGAAPWLGEVVTVTLTRVPNTAPAILVAGWATTAPVALQQLGRPGCSSVVTYDAVLSGTAVQGAIDWRLSVPSQPALLGAQLHQQALVLDPGAPAGFSVSNAITLEIGGR